MLLYRTRAEREERREVRERPFRSPTSSALSLKVFLYLLQSLLARPSQPPHFFLFKRLLVSSSSQALLSAQLDLFLPNLASLLYSFLLCTHALINSLLITFRWYGRVASSCNIAWLLSPTSSLRRRSDPS